jgi:hypothetical protein
MAKLVTVVALIAASITPALSQNDQPGLRCTDADKAMTQRLRDLVVQDRDRLVGTPTFNAVLAQISSARHDCKRGRIERGLRTYAHADLALQAIEEASQPLTARSSAAD